MTGKPDSVLFMGPSADQTEVLATHMRLSGHQPWWTRKQPDGTLVTDLSVYYAAGSTLRDPGQQRKAYDYAHELRRELARRKLLPVPDLKIPRCEVCHHGTEKLFATTEATHTIVDSRDETKMIFPNLCVQCWSRLHNDSPESE